SPTPPPPRPTLLPYTTLFRSPTRRAHAPRAAAPRGRRATPAQPGRHPGTRARRERRREEDASCASETPTLRSQRATSASRVATRSEEHTSELQSQSNLVCRLL